MSFLELKIDSIVVEGPVAQRIRHLTTNQGIPGSIPGVVEALFFVSCIVTKPTPLKVLLKKGYSWWSLTTCSCAY